MSLLSECDLLVFDCDGVLVDSETLSMGTIVDVLRSAGIPATMAMIQGCFGMKMPDTLARVAQEAGVAVPAEVAGRIWPATLAAYEAGLLPTRGIEAFLDATAAVPRCVASSSDLGRIAVSLALTGLSARFGEHVFSSHQVARGKPAPDLFLLAAREMGADPARCVVIEDSRHGVRAARAAGMTAVGFTGGSHVEAGHARLLSAEGASHVSGSWADLLAFMSR